MTIAFEESCLAASEVSMTGKMHWIEVSYSSESFEIHVKQLGEPIRIDDAKTPAEVACRFSISSRLAVDQLIWTSRTFRA